MHKRLASLFLLLVLAGSAFAGVPLHFGESECSMGGMMDMDCCKAALAQKDVATVAEAELLCALNCAQNATASLPNMVRVTPPSQTNLSIHPALNRPIANVLSFCQHVYASHSPPDSPPTYLRNLTLLI